MSGSGAEGNAVRVLVVDDDEKNLQAMAALLARVPAEVVLARSGVDALRQLLAGDFAVILLDVHMPGMSGLETAALIRERERSRRTPIIFLTAFSRTEAQLLGAYRLGAVDFLTKPIQPEEVLLDKVAWFVESHRHAARLEDERRRAREAEHREHERAVTEAKRRGEAEALRSEMQRQRELAARLNRANERLHVVSSIASGLLFAEEPARVLPQLSDVLAARLGIDVYLLHRATPDGTLALAAHGGVAADALEALAAMTPDRQVFAAAGSRREPVVVEGAACAAEWPELGRIGLASAACFPLVADRLLGTVTFGSREAKALDPDLLAALELSAEHFASALDRARLVEELRRRADDLAEADRHKDEFLAMLGHELRNPLAPVVNGLEILRDVRAGPGARQRALDASDRQLRHLVRLVDDLVDVSRIRNGKVELRRAAVELARIVDDAVAAVEPLARAQGQELAVELPGRPVTLDGDAVRLTQVLENLLQNASKYTDAGGHIRLAASVDEDGLLVVRVSDDGIGIAPDLLPRIFQTFVQGKQPPNRARGGLGLGLTLVRSLVEMHGGAVRATSDGPGRGSTFEVRLPVAREVAAPPPEPRPAPAHRRNGHARAAPLNIAVIEDNPDIRDTVRELLELAGHKVCVASDGRAGVQLLLAERPDVALVDIGLPGLDGYEVARQVRGACETRLVALTGYGAHGDRERATVAGFDAHLVKPVEFEELAAVVERLAEKRAIQPPAGGGAQPCQRT